MFSEIWAFLSDIDAGKDENVPIDPNDWGYEADIKNFADNFLNVLKGHLGSFRSVQNFSLVLRFNTQTHSPLLHAVSKTRENSNDHNSKVITNVSLIVKA